jgi:tetrahedral aminopeptidase
MFELIKELTELPGPVGQEGVVVNHVEELWQAEGAETRRTKVGNLLARVGGKGPKLLLVAHADELCYLVRAIDENGYIWLANGQAWTRTMPLRNSFAVGQRVKVLGRAETIPGVIATVTGHLAHLALPDLTELTWNDFWVDTGLTRDGLLAKGITPGTRIIWDASTERFGPHVVGKALDDRAPLAVLTEVLRRVEPDQLAWNVTLGCTVQEEIGMRGASALGASEEFDAAIALEIGMAGDIPSVNLHDMPTRLGGGPILVHKDAQIHYDYALTKALEEAAAAAGIAIQHAVFGAFGSDGIALTMADIPSALIAFPARYTHTPFETAHLGDIASMVDWLCAFVKKV